MSFAVSKDWTDESVELERGYRAIDPHCGKLRKASVGVQAERNPSAFLVVTFANATQYEIWFNWCLITLRLMSRELLLLLQKNAKSSLWLQFRLSKEDAPRAHRRGSFRRLSFPIHTNWDKLCSESLHLMRKWELRICGFIISMQILSCNSNLQTARISDRSAAFIQNCWKSALTSHFTDKFHPITATCISLYPTRNNGRGTNSTQIAVTAQPPCKLHTVADYRTMRMSSRTSIPIADHLRYLGQFAQFKVC